MDIQENVPLAPFTTFRVGGTARYFAEVTAHRQLADLVAFARQKRIPIFILGGGSNLLVGDNGFPGLVIRVGIKGVSLKSVSGAVSLTAGAGEVWDDVVRATVDRGLWGIENLSGIPGSVGASVVQNIGAYGAEVGDAVSHVEVYDRGTGETRLIPGHECRFGYRDSIFKKPEGRDLVVTRVTYLLQTEGVPQVDYGDFSAYATRHGIRYETPADVRTAVLAIRASKLPDITRLGTAGSFFKNPVISRDQYEGLKVRYPEMPHFEAGDGLVKVPLAWILDKICGLKGYREGMVGLYEHQPLALVNYGEATASDIAGLARKIAVHVKEKTAIIIDPEVVSVGVQLC